MSQDRICPHYLGESPTHVRCRGWTPETVQRLAFARRDHAKAYKLRHCHADYESCLMFRMLNAARTGT